MPSYRSYYRRYRRRPRRYIRRYFKRRFRRFINGSSKSTARIRTSVESTFKINSGADGAPSATPAAVIAFGRTNNPANHLSVLNSPLYRTYTALYDQVKCIGMKVSISIVDAIGGSTLPSVQIYTSWDRQHLGNGDSIPSGPEMKNASTYNVATALNNNVAKLTRSLYASDLMEKAIWHDCSLTYTPASSGPPPTEEYWDDNVYKNSTNLPLFSPAFFLAVATPTLAAATEITISCSVVYYMAFRNPKFGASSGLPRIAELGARSGIALDGGDDNGDMDDDDPFDRRDRDRVLPSGTLDTSSLSEPNPLDQERARLQDAMRQERRDRAIHQTRSTTSSFGRPGQPVVVRPPN